MRTGKGACTPPAAYADSISGEGASGRRGRAGGRHSQLIAVAPHRALQLEESFRRKEAALPRTFAANVRDPLLPSHTPLKNPSSATFSLTSCMPLPLLSPPPQKRTWRSPRSRTAPTSRRARAPSARDSPRRPSLVSSPSHPSCSPIPTGTPRRVTSGTLNGNFCHGQSSVTVNPLSYRRTPEHPLLRSALLLPGKPMWCIGEVAWASWPASCPEPLILTVASLASQIAPLAAPTALPSP